MQATLAAWRWPYIFVALCALLTHGVGPAFAQGQTAAPPRVSQQDVDADGRPDVAVIEAAFATGRDLIYVVDQGRNMEASRNWQEATDFDDDIWLYDIGADGSVQLIVVYKVENGSQVADIYDDRDDDGQVEHRRSGTQVSIRESPFWTARITSASRWFLPDGKPNLTVRLDFDGPMLTNRMPLAYARDYMRHDGNTDLTFEEIADSDGIARYALMRLLTPSPDDWGFQRSGLQSNEGRYPTRLPERPYFFPFLVVPLDPVSPEAVGVRYFDFPPYVSVDWQKGQVTGPALDGYPIGHGYHFNNNRYIDKSTVNDVAFESPQAYYDLANNHDAFPELHIRFFTRAAYDQTMWSPPGKGAVPWQSISYSWNLFNPGTLRWDFKLGLAGNFDIDEVVAYPDFTVHMVPFADLPGWIADREWKITTFVAREGAGYDSAEGIYEWQTDTGDDPEKADNRADEARDASLGYTTGLVAEPPTDFFVSARQGFRAERILTRPAKPGLYLSAFDGRLHLLGAEAGVWNIDDRDSVRYANLDGDNYLDHWQYFEGEDLRREVIFAGPYAIYAGENQVLLKETTTRPALFETQPPRSQDDWQTMRSRLETSRSEASPGQLRAPFDRLTGTQSQIVGARLRDVRAFGKDGFRFILDLEPGFRAGATSPLPLRGLQPGEYAVTYDGRWTVVPATPAQLSLSVRLPSEPSTLGSTVPVQVEVTNAGREDARELSVVASARHDGTVTRLTGNDLDALAGQTSQVGLEWKPAEPGTWQLELTLWDGDGNVLAEATAPFEVRAGQSASPWTVLSFSTGDLWRLPGFLLLLGFAFVIGFALRNAWRGAG